MKWKVISGILAVIAVGALATTLLVSRGSRTSKEIMPSEPQIATAPLTTQNPPAQVSQAPTSPAKPNRVKSPERKSQPTATKNEKVAIPQEGTQTTPAVVLAKRIIPAGTRLTVTLRSGLSSDNASVQDPVEAVTAEPLVVDDIVLARAGSTISGNVTNVVRASRNKSEETLARLDMVFNSLETVGGTEHIRGVLSGGEKKASSTSGRDAGVIVGSGVAGAVLGKIIGKSGKATAAGGVIGTAAGIGVSAMRKGNEVTLPAGTQLTILLETPVEVAVKR